MLNNDNPSQQEVVDDSSTVVIVVYSVLIKQSRKISKYFPNPRPVLMIDKEIIFEMAIYNN